MYMPEGAVSIPEIVFERYFRILQSAETKTFLTLYREAWSGDGNGKCRISIDRLSEKTRLCKTTVCKSLKGLIKKGVIKVVERRALSQASCYLVMRDGSCNVTAEPPPEQFRHSSGDREIAQQGMDTGPTPDQVLAALKEGAFRQKYEEWLKVIRAEPPNAVIARYVAAPGPLSEKVLRQYFQDSIFEPWLRAQAKGGFS